LIGDAGRHLQSPPRRAAAERGSRRALCQPLPL